jgi:hypothetical protein
MSLEFYVLKWICVRKRVGGTDWIDLAQDRDQWRGTFEHGNELSGCTKCWEIPE